MMQADEILARDSDLAAFGTLIGAVYETALDPAAWPRALDGIRAAIGGGAAWIATHYPDQVRSVYQIEVGTDPGWQRQLRERYVAASPFMGVTHHLKRGDVVAVGDVVDYEEFLAGRFYREWAGPQGWPDIVMAVATKTRDRFSWLGICLPARASPAQKAMAARLLPHIERALRISDLLEDSEARSQDLTAAIEGMASGMVLLDAELNVRGINAAARRMLSEVTGVTLMAERLSFATHGPSAELAVALAACVEGRSDAAGASVLLDRSDGVQQIAAHVLPLARNHRVGDARAVAALFLADPVQAGQPPMDSFVSRYGMTPSETRVLVAILEGKSPRAIAAAQGVSLPTVRTHLSRLYDKTGTRGQADLVRLTVGLTRPV